MLDLCKQLTAMLITESGFRGLAGSEILDRPVAAFSLAAAFYGRPRGKTSTQRKI
jgi:hypothetical protein